MTANNHIKLLERLRFLCTDLIPDDTAEEVRASIEVDDIISCLIDTFPVAAPVPPALAAAQAQEGTKLNNLPTLTGLMKELDADLADASESNLVHIEITDPAHAARLRSDIVRLVNLYRLQRHMIPAAARIQLERTGVDVDVSGFPT